MCKLSQEMNVKSAVCKYSVPAAVIFLVVLLVVLKFNSKERVNGLTETDTQLLRCNEQSPQLHFVEDVNAKCIDGSSPAYYVRHGWSDGKDKWIVFFEGGGWCYDLEACKLRSATILGSSKAYPKCLKNNAMNFYISARQGSNPLMHNWNTVLVKYCDGSSYAGDAVQSFDVSICTLM